MPVDLMLLLPPYFQAVYEYQVLMDIEGAELETAKRSLEQIKKNLYVQTCDDSTLREYEQLLGIVRERGAAMEYRRRMILSRMNQQLPYSLPKLKEILDAALGRQWYELEIRYGIYELELDVIDQSYQVLKNIQAMVEEIIPAHLRYIFAGRYPVEIPVDIATISRLELITDFYARYNREFLYLDGSWTLDGTYLLNGYKEAVGLDLYPARTTIQSVWRSPVTSSWSWGYGTGAWVAPETGTDLRITGATAGQPAGDGRMGLAWAQPVALEMDCQLRVEHNLWYLDGTAFLDGSSFLDAEIYEYDL